ncbi:proline-rich protein 36-like [Aricia agestis]|uniref:proline-rich protein 36-like n=1 Tax=Aricia agestis TaxID=91739 RepID=UPI001C206D2B|nr:proline-rich protein 36-like [Aricia agestis]
MKITLLLLSILLIHTVTCQRRGPWRGMRPPPRRLPPCIEERLRSIAPNLPNYRTPEIPAIRPPEVPVAPCKIEAPSTLEAVAQLVQNIPKPDIPTADLYQNVLLSPNIFGMMPNQMPNQIVPNQIAPNQIVPNQMLPTQIAPNQIVPTHIVPNQIIPNRLLPPEIPRNYQIPMQNLQYLNLLIPKPEIREIPVEIPRAEKIIVQPSPTVEAEQPCPCKSPPSMNPFLPAASPVSPWMASNFPAVSSQSRSHFLRKIPIPPPTV